MNVIGSFVPASRWRVRTRFVAVSMTIMALSLTLAIGLVALIGSDYRRADQSFRSIVMYRDVLIAANKLSAERGPTNTLLGRDHDSSPDAVQKLRAAREASDMALDHIARLDENNPALQAAFVNAKRQLAIARSVADKTFMIPYAVRTRQSIAASVDEMFKAVDTLRPLIIASALGKGEGTTLADEALIGQMLFELRDNAGRLGSILAPYIAKQEPIDQEDLRKLQRVRGRNQQLWELAKPHLLRHASLSQSIGEAERVYFDEGLKVVDVLEHEALTGRFTFTTRSMTETIVPTFAPLEKLRLSYLELMLDVAEARLGLARRYLLAVGVITLLIIAINLVLLTAARRSIFEPLLKARDGIVALSDEADLDRAISSPPGGPEMDEVFAALEDLRKKLLQRRAMTTELSVQASTDGLTGLLNRRELDQICSDASRHPSASMAMSLIVADIDKFKAINDSYGHAVGDIVIKSVAAQLKAKVRAGDLIARYGGEEFVILLPGVALETAMAIAEKLRASIAACEINPVTGPHIHVTASFGVAHGQKGLAEWHALFLAADQALYAAKSGGRNCVCAAPA